MADRFHRILLALFLAALSFGAAAAQAAPATPSRAVPGTHDCSNYYPETARRLSQSGRVLIAYDVLADGRIANVRLVQSSGYDQLDRAAVLCVAQRWRNVAASRGGIPIASPDHQAYIQFTLHDSAEPAPPAAPDVDIVFILIVAGLALLALIVLAYRWGNSRRACPACGAINRSPFADPAYCSHCGVRFGPQA